MKTFSATIFTSLLCILASCRAKENIDNNKNMEPRTDPMAPEEVVVSKGAYKHVVIIGVDGAGTLEYSLPAQMDEFIMTSDVLGVADVAALKEYYKP